VVRLVVSPNEYTFSWHLPEDIFGVGMPTTSKVHVLLSCPFGRFGTATRLCHLDQKFEPGEVGGSKVRRNT
jgi:hypothetical protein